MENKNFFEAWLETQKQLMENWKESNTKLQEAVKNGSAMKDGQNIYQEWLSKQAEITKSASENAVTGFQAQLAENATHFRNGKSVADLSSVYSKWMEAQREAAEKAFGNYNSFMQPFTGNNKFATDSLEQFRNFQQQWWNGTQNFFNQSQQFTQQWQSQFQNWGKGLSDDTIRDTWNNMTNMSASYMKFYELWQPAYKNMLNNSFNADWLKTSFNPESFRELIDRTLSWISPVQTKELFQQWTNWTEVVNNYNKHVYQQFAGNIPENMKNLTPFLLFGNDANNPYNNAFSVYQRAISPLVRLFYPGKESELNDLVASMMEKISVYGQKLGALQQHLYTTGAKSWETFLFSNFDQLKKGADLSNLQEVFNQWVTKNEESFTTLFASEEYSKLQGELLDLSLEIKQGYEKVAEMLIAPLPVLRKSEADDLYKTIYDLRKRLHALEKQQSETVTAQEKENKTLKKKPATV